MLLVLILTFLPAVASLSSWWNLGSWSLWPLWRSYPADEAPPSEEDSSSEVASPPTSRVWQPIKFWRSLIGSDPNSEAETMNEMEVSVQEGSEVAKR